MEFRIGDLVWIKNLKREGVVKEIPRPGQITVLMGSLIVHCRWEDLALPPKKSKKKHLHTKTTPSITHSASTGRPVPDMIDLHGKTVDEAMALVESTINRAIIQKKHQLRVMHGLGTGKLRTAIHAYLKSADFVGSFQIDPANPGVTIVYF